MPVFVNVTCGGHAAAKYVYLIAPRRIIATPAPTKIIGTTRELITTMFGCFSCMIARYQVPSRSRRARAIRPATANRQPYAISAEEFVFIVTPTSYFLTSETLVSPVRGIFCTRWFLHQSPRVAFCFVRRKHPKCESRGGSGSRPISKSFAKVTARRSQLTGKRSRKLRISKWKPVCSRLRLAACCSILPRNCKWNGAGWNNFRPRNSKMKSGRIPPVAFDRETKPESKRNRATSCVRAD